jgi:hypothetical protein
MPPSAQCPMSPLAPAMKPSRGQILISPRVLMKVENAVTVEPVGEFELKDQAASGGVQCPRRARIIGLRLLSQFS